MSPSRFLPAHAEPAIPEHTGRPGSHEGSWLAAHERAARALATAASPAEAMAEVLPAVCEALGWQLGAYWAFDASAGLLSCAAIWATEGGGLPELAAAARTFALRPGEGGPGRVMQGGAPLWISDADAAVDSDERHWATAAAARRAGLRAGVGFPVRIDGDVRAVLELFTRAPLTPDPGLLRGLDVVAHQIALAEQRSAARQALREAVRARDDLLAIVSHDLRNPLGVVLTSASLLLKGPLLAASGDDRARRQIEAIQRAGNRMNRLIRDLLDFAHIKGGRLAIAMRRHDAGGLVDDVVTTLEPQAAQKGQRLCRQLPPGLAVRCDRERMVQALTHVVDNALKFTPEGGEVTVRAERRGGEVVITVADTGPGMSPEELANVFDRYWQAQRMNREGIGLGLSIVKGIVDAHGGRVWCESPPGQGAHFHLALPALPEELASSSVSY